MTLTTARFEALGQRNRRVTYEYIGFVTTMLRA